MDPPIFFHPFIMFTLAIGWPRIQAEFEMYMTFYLAFMSWVFGLVQASFTLV